MSGQHEFPPIQREAEARGAGSSRGEMGRRTAALALILLGGGLLLFHGQLVSSDEVLMGRGAFALAREGKLTFPEVYGRNTSQYGIYCSLQGAPWAWAEMGLRWIGAIQADVSVTLLPLANLVNVVLLALYARAFSRRLGASDEASAFAAALLVIATPFLPYSASYFSEPATALALTATAYHLGVGLRRARIEDSRSASEGLRESCGNMGKPETVGIRGEDGKDGSGGGWGWNPLVAGAWMAVALHTRVITAALWPIWLALALGSRPSAGRGHGGATGLLARLAVFPLLGVVVLLALNAIQRGGPLRMGYETSEFTTPVATGLFGLLLSPDRGILPQAPLVILGVWGWVACCRGLRREGLVCGALVAIWLALHATFWTWHGGWTPGPRFLLPLLPIILLPLGLLLERSNEWRGGALVVAAGVVAWGFVQAVAQTLVNPLDWNNELWGFLGQIESRFLFEPQVSSWRGLWTLIGDGAFRQPWLRLGRVEGTMAVAAAQVIAGLGCLSVAASQIEWGGMRRGLRSWASRLRGWVEGAGRPVAICVLVVIIVWAVAWALSGPRGLTLEVRGRGGEFEATRTLEKQLRWEWPAGSLSARLAEADSRAGDTSFVAAWEGLFDLPLDGKYVFSLKARGVYRVTLGDKALFTNDDPAKPQHIPQAAVELTPGRYPVRIEFGPDTEGGGVFRLFWQWPGEGIVLEPVAKEYLLPRELTGLEEGATWLRRHGLALAALAIATAAVATLRPRRSGED